MPDADHTAEHHPEHAADAGRVLEALGTLDERYLEEGGQRLRAAVRGPSLMRAIRESDYRRGGT